MNDYQVRTDIYNGPMDLLLYLIRRDEIDIYDIPLAQVTQTYCEYVALLQTIDPNIAGDFLVMAATLMEMKSRMLLPRPVTEEGEPEDLSDPRLELVRQLLEYKKFKDASFELGNSAYEQAMKWPRVPVKIKMQDAGEVDLEDVQIWDLVGAFNKLMSSIGARRSTHDVVFDDTPISLHAADVVDRLVGEGGKMRFEHIFEGRNKVEMIGLFLALLELMRQHRVQVAQHGAFGSIQIKLLSTEPIQIGEDIDSALDEAAGGSEQSLADEQVPADEPKTIEPGESDVELTALEENDASPDKAATADGDEGKGGRAPGERRAPRKHWKEPIASFDIEKDELFAELEQIKTNFDIDAIIRESKQRGSRKAEEGEADEAAEDVTTAQTADAPAYTEASAEANTEADARETAETAVTPEDTTAESAATETANDEAIASESPREAGVVVEPHLATTDEVESQQDSNETSEAPAEAAPSAESEEVDGDESTQPPADESAPDDQVIANGSASSEQTDMDEPALQPNTESDPS